MDRYLVIPLVALKELNLNDVLILSQLIYMKKAFKEIYPSNAYLSNKLSMPSRTVQRSIAKLTHEHYITFKVKYNNMRYIKITIKSRKIFGLLKKNINSSDKININNEALNTFYKMLDNN
jgi:CTP-dependent riboflavin kinase